MDDETVKEAREFFEKGGFDTEGVGRIRGMRNTPPRESLDREVSDEMGDSISIGELLDPEQLIHRPPGALENPAEVLEGKTRVLAPKDVLLEKLVHWLKTPDALTPKQRATMGLRFGLDTPPDKPSATISRSTEAKVLDQTYETVRRREEGALNRIRKALGIKDVADPSMRDAVHGPSLPIRPGDPRKVPVEPSQVEYVDAFGPAFGLARVERPAFPSGPRTKTTSKYSIQPEATKLVRPAPQEFFETVGEGPEVVYRPISAHPSGIFPHRTEKEVIKPLAQRITVDPGGFSGGIRADALAQGPPRRVVGPAGEVADRFPIASRTLFPSSTRLPRVIPGEVYEVPSTLTRRRVLRPSDAPEVMLPDRDAPNLMGETTKEKIKNLKQVVEEQFVNQQGGWRLKPDPNGDILIGGERYKRVRVKYRQPKDPVTKKRKRVFTEEE
jgi:hypothetical protein